jgi:protocatechuate 3,4-dioxygenase alpha subunit
MPIPTSSQTVGPFFHDCLIREGENILVRASEHSQGIRIVGRVLDGAGEPVTDALLELWQAGPDGVYPGYDAAGNRSTATADFCGFGRAATDAEGKYLFETLKPGRVPAAEGGLQAPHINVAVMARGMLKRLVTRIYFDDESATLNDPVLARGPGRQARASLIAQRQDDATVSTYCFDVVLQGENETVFFDV